MKKLMYLALAFIAIVTGFTACQQKSMVTSGDNTWFSMDSVAPFFYAIEMHKYDFNAGREMVNDLHMGKKSTFFSGGCTEVRYNNIVGRNLDWNVNDEAAAVLWMPEADSVKYDTVAVLLGCTKRFSSVGMVGANPHFKYPCIISQEVGDTLSNTLALSITDGINEKGVYIGVNVAPAGETSADSTRWKSGHWGIGAAFTNPDNTSDSTTNAMCVTYLTRIILNYAENVDNAVDIIKRLNWFEPYHFEYDSLKQCTDTLGQSFHWLICDTNKSVVVEFLDNKPVITTSKNIQSLDEGSVMTNYTNCLKDRYALIQHGGSGYERTGAVHTYYYSHGGNIASMRELMHLLHYSNFYHRYYNEHDNKADYDFRTEFAIPGIIPADSIIRSRIMSERICKIFVDSLDAICKKWPPCKKASYIREKFPNEYWYSTHTCIYDLPSKSFKVLIHEGMDELDYDKKDLNKLYYDASLYDPGNVKRVKNQ